MFNRSTTETIKPYNIRNRQVRPDSLRAVLLIIFYEGHMISPTHHQHILCCIAFCITKFYPNNMTLHNKHKAHSNKELEYFSFALQGVSEVVFRPIFFSGFYDANAFNLSKEGSAIMCLMSNILHEFSMYLVALLLPLLSVERFVRVRISLPTGVSFRIINFT